MNPVVVVHGVAAAVAIVVAVPLIRRRVKMNHWYGVRIPAAFESEEAWSDLNHYGGCLLVIWGLLIGLTALVGTFLERRDWVTYDWTSLVVIFAGLLTVVAKIYQYARRKRKG